MSQSVVIVGFPKCGTSALVRAMAQLPGVELLKSRSGALEMPKDELAGIEAELPPSGAIRVHKQASYVYSANDIKRLSLQPRTFIACVRDPALALISWHKMYQTIAQSADLQNHLAWREREFYADCTVADYYERFAKDKLRYDFYLARLFKAVDQVMVVSQERMAQDMAGVIRFCLDQSVPAVPSHVAFADGKRASVPKKISTALKDTQRRVLALIAESGVKAMV